MRSKWSQSNNPQSFQQETSLAKIKKKIRDTERMLKRDNIPAHIIQEQERKLKALQLSLQDQTISKKEQKVASKYKMVKFFERQKIQRKISHSRNLLQKNPENSKLLDTLQMYKDQLNYVQYFPRATPYISLYPRSPCTDTAVITKRESIMSDIKKKVKSHELKDAEDVHTNAKIAGKKTEDFSGEESQDNEEYNSEEADLIEEDSASESEPENATKRAKKTDKKLKTAEKETSGSEIEEDEDELSGEFDEEVSGEDDDEDEDEDDDDDDQEDLEDEEDFYEE